MSKPSIKAVFPGGWLVLLPDNLGYLAFAGSFKWFESIALVCLWYRSGKPNANRLKILYDIHKGEAHRILYGLKS